jgi:ubiquinone/menaquinone biosynthesis C-methylase UbiE
MNGLPDFEAVTRQQKKVWSEGDFAMVAGLVFNASENLAEELEILPDERVLDVACGSGNGAISAARRAWGGNVVGADYVPALLERGRERAAAERLEIEFVEADAQNLRFGEASFDVAMSVFGAMFAPDQRRTAAELLRVVKPGGRIGMANWCPDGAVGRMFETTAKHAPPPPDLDPALLWGTEERLRELFGDGIADLRTKRRISRQPYRSAAHYLEFFRTNFGPVKVAFERVGSEGEAALESDLLELLERENTAGERALVLEAEYLEVIATRA